MRTTIARLSFSCLVILFSLSFCAFLQTQKVPSPADKKGFAPLYSVYVADNHRIELTSAIWANLVKVAKGKTSSKERYIIVYTYEYTFINRSNNWVSLYFANAEAPSSQLVLKPWEERREILITERVPEIFSVNVTINIQVNKQWSRDGVIISLMYFPALTSHLQPKTARIFWQLPKSTGSFF